MSRDTKLPIYFMGTKQKRIQGEELSTIRGWKSVLLLQFQPQFQTTIMIGIVFGFISSMVDFMYAICNDKISANGMQLFFAQGLYIFDGFYFIELLLMMIYKSVVWKEIKYIYPPRHGFIVIPEFISILPIELAVLKNPKTMCWMRLRYSVRMVRLILYAWQKEKKCDISSTMMIIMNLQIIYFLVSMISSFCIVPLVNIPFKQYLTDEKLMLFVYAITSKITAKGFGMAIGGNRIFEYSLCLLTIIAFVMTSYYTSKVACALIPWIKHKFSFAHNYKRINEYIKLRCASTVVRKSNLYHSYEKTFVRHFEVSLDNASTSIHKELPRGKVADSVLREISLDICWPALKHSHLFRDQEVYFLRRLSRQMEHRYFLPGEPVYKKQLRKACMVYVVSGIVQIISEENSETPILSLSGGSCLGETSLLIDYPATYTVISKTYSEIILLRRKKFMKMIKVFPKVCRRLALIVNERYKKAIDYHKVRTYQQKLYYELSGVIEDPSIMYIEVTLKRLLYNEKQFGKEKRLRRAILQNFCFCADYLDLLSITEELELVTDSFYVKKTFPYIFQPDSLLIQAWDLIVGVISTILVLIYPLMVCTTSATAQTMFFKYYFIIITFLWSFDIYLKISTAVKTRNAFLTSISSIIYYRLSSASFLIDLVCVFPLGMIVSLMHADVNSRVMLLLEIHKLLKIYRMHFFLSHFGHLNSTTLIVNKYMKVVIYTFLLIYYSACSFYLMLCDNGCDEVYLHRMETYYNINRNDSLLIFIQLYAVSSYFINDVEVFEVFSLLTAHQIVCTIIMQILYACVYIYLLADAIATDTVNQQEKHEFKEFVSDMDIIMKKFRFQPVLQKKVSSFLMDQYAANMSTTFLNPKINEEVLSKDLFILHQFIMYSTYLWDIPLFTYLEDKTITEICRRVNVVTYPSNQIITNAGEICKEMHFIIHGLCKRIDKKGRVTILKSNDYFSVFELVAGILNVHTVVTVTDCMILSIDVQNYRRIIRKYQVLGEQVTLALNYCKIMDDYDSIEGDAIIQIESVVTKMIQPPSFHIFKMYKRRSDNLSFHIGYTRFAKIFKYLLMRITITPYGNALFGYEISRVILILFTNFLCSSVIILDEHHFSYALLVCDVLSWIDIYIMHHISYFNEVGLEIYHPWYTAKHYWSHSFLIDILGCLPIDYPFEVNRRMSYYLRLNRCFQIHRILAFFNYLNANNISRTGIQDILKYFPLCALIINYIALFFLSSHCDFVISSLFEEDECACRFLVKRKMHNITFIPSNMQASSLLFISSTLAMIGMTRFYLKTYREMVFLTILVLFAVIFSIWLTAKMVANNFYRNSDLTTYQQAIKEMVMFFSYRKVDKNIKNEIIDHYEYVWQKKRCKDLHHMTSYFNTCFKEDLLYDIFGEALKSSRHFPNANRSFYKSLLLEMQHIVLLKRAIIYKVNDVHNKIYFLLQGEVDVLGPDYKKLLVLTPGSLFGSLDNYPFMRQTLMMVAKSNLELLCVPSNRFHYILSQYRKVYARYLHLTNSNNDYLECHHRVDHQKQKNDESDKVHRTNRLIRIYCKLNPVYKRSTLMKSWELAVLMLTGFVGFHFEIFQKVMWTYSRWVLILLYCLDVLHLVKVYLKFHTSYVNELGMTVTSRRKIFKYYFKSSPVDAYVDIISALPFEVVSLGITGLKTRAIVFSFFRLNRALRVICVCNVFKSALEKLYINVVIMRILFICILLSIYIHILSGILVYIRFWLRVYTPDYYDRLTLYESSLLVVLYTTMGNSINNFTVTFNFSIVVYCVLVTIMGRFIITLFIAESCAIMESVNKNKNMYKVLLTQINTFVCSKYVSRPLQKDISWYLRLMWIHHQGVHFPQLLEHAPYYLREATLNAMFGCHLRKHPVLGNFHVDLIRQMAAEMRLVILFPGNVVVNKGDIDGCMYFIHQGVIDALSEDTIDSEVVEDTFVVGNSFGLIQGIHPRYGHDYTYKVREHAILVTLKRKCWFYKLSLFPASQEILSDYLSSQINLFENN